MEIKKIDFEHEAITIGYKNNNTTILSPKNTKIIKRGTNSCTTYIRVPKEFRKGMGKKGNEAEIIKLGNLFLVRMGKKIK